MVSQSMSILLIALYVACAVLPPWIIKALAARVAEVGGVASAAIPRPDPVEFARAVVAEHGLTTKVIGRGDGNRFDLTRNIVYLTETTATRTDGGAYAAAAHEVAHAIRFHRGDFASRVRTVLSKAVLLTTAFLLFLSFLVRVGGAPSAFGAVPAVILGHKAFMAAAAVVFSVTQAVTVVDEWRTSFPGAMRLMACSGILSDEELAWGRGSLRAALGTYITGLIAVPLLCVALYSL